MKSFHVISLSVLFLVGATPAGELDILIGYNSSRGSGSAIESVSGATVELRVFQPIGRFLHGWSISSTYGQLDAFGDSEDYGSFSGGPVVLAPITEDIYVGSGAMWEVPFGPTDGNTENFRFPLIVGLSPAVNALTRLRVEASAFVGTSFVRSSETEIGFRFALGLGTTVANSR